MTIIATSAFKGGVGKTTTAVCLATLLAERGPTVLIDADPNSKSAQVWAAKGLLPFEVLDDDSARKRLMAGEFEHVVIDSQISPQTGEVAGLCKGSDLLIVPSPPRQLDLASLTQVFGEVPAGAKAIALLTMTPPSPQTDAEDARESLRAGGVRVFDRNIRASKEYSKAALAGKTLKDMPGRAGIYWRDWPTLMKEIDEVLADG